MKNNIKYIYKLGINYIESKIQKYNVITIMITLCIVSFLVLAIIQNKEVKKDNLDNTRLIQIDLPLVENKTLSDEQITKTRKKEITEDKAIVFINTYKKIAKIQQKKYHIPTSVILASGLLESDKGNSDLASKANNLHGMKVKPKEKLSKKEKNLISGYVLHKTKEFVDGKFISSDEKFCKYKNKAKSIEHFAFFINKRRDSWKSYKHLSELKSTDWKGWVNGLNKSPYSTDPLYGNKLEVLIKKYNLDQYDK